MIKIYICFQDTMWVLLSVTLLYLIIMFMRREQLCTSDWVRVIALSACNALHIINEIVSGKMDEAMV